MADRAAPNPERNRSIAPRWRIAAAAALVCLLLSTASSGFANSYSRGNWLCEDFEDMEQSHRSEPENILLQRGYAHCLITGGDDLRGLNILHNIVDHSTHPARVGAAWMIANYLSSGGTFENRIDENNINEAIKAFKRVVFFIDLDPDYPEVGNSIYEEEVQIELKTHYLFLHCILKKLSMEFRAPPYWQTSLSYKGDRGLNTYPQYSPYTIDSLEKMIEFADACLALPRKRHFQLLVLQS